MKLRLLLAAFVVVCAVGFVAVPGFTEEEPNEEPKAGEPSAEAMAEMQQKWMELAMPGDNHAWFHFMAGKWTGEGTVWVYPDADPMTMVGKVKAELVMDGRYVRTQWSSEWGGMPFKGEATFGYCNATKKYQSTWIDSGSTWITMDTGTRKADEVHMTGSHVSVVGPYEARSVTTKISKDEYRTESFATYEGQPEFQSMVVVYKRVK